MTAGLESPGGQRPDAGSLRSVLGPDVVLATYALLLLVLPSSFTFGSYAVTAATVVGLLAAGLWLGGLILPDRISAVGSEPARRGVLVYFAIALVAYLVAMLRPLNDTAAGGADRNLVALVSVVGVALLAVDGVRTRHALHRVLGALVAGGGVLASIGILQYVAHFDIAPRLRLPGFAASETTAFVFTRAGFDRVAGTARHPIEFGIVCAMLLPIALHMSRHATATFARRSSLVVAGLLGLAVPMALSRAAVLAVLAGLVIMLPSWPPARRMRVIAGVGAIGLIASTLAAGTLETIGDLFFGDAAAGSDEARRRATSAALKLVGEAPWLGRGYGTFQDVIVDNQFIVTAVEAGVVGVVALLVLGNGVILACRETRRRSDDVALRDLGMTLIAVVVATAVASTGLATIVYPTTAGVLFLVVGLAGATDRIAGGEVPATADAGLALVHS